MKLPSLPIVLIIPRIILDGYSLLGMGDIVRSFSVQLLLESSPFTLEWFLDPTRSLFGVLVSL